MLILSRKVGQKLLIEIPGMAEPVVIEVASIKGGRVGIGIFAMPDVRVARGELRGTPTPIDEGTSDARERKTG